MPRARARENPYRIHRSAGGIRDALMKKPPKSMDKTSGAGPIAAASCGVPAPAEIMNARPSAHMHDSMMKNQW